MTTTISALPCFVNPSTGATFHRGGCGQCPEVTNDAHLHTAIREAESVHVQSCPDGWAICTCTLAKAIRLLEKSIVQGVGRIA